jgi:hypothetical protein
VTFSGALQDVDCLGPVTRFIIAAGESVRLQAMTIAPPAASGPVTVTFDPGKVVVLESKA